MRSSVLVWVELGFKALCSREKHVSLIPGKKHLFILPWEIFKLF